MIDNEKSYDFRESTLEPILPPLSKMSANRPIFFDKVILRYGEVFKDLDPLCLNDLNHFSLWIKNRGQIWSLIKQKTLPEKWFYEILDQYEIFAQSQGQAKLHAQTHKVFDLLYKHGRLNMLPALLLWINGYHEAKKKVYMHTARPWSSQEIKEMEEKIEVFLGFSVDLHVSVDASLMWGGVLLWDGCMLDLSFQRIFTHLQQEIAYV